jgi:cytosine/adenosine deaminase-related metal-dependent hydrolase
MRAACAAMADAGTAHAGDICGSLPNGLTAIADACAASGLGVTHLCEWFGHAPLPSADELPWPSTCRREVAGIGEAACAPACHALYSVAPSTLAAVRTHCRQRGITFSMHLAESPEETLMLAEGRGALRDFLAQRVLPGNFRAPGMRPLGYARQLGLLGPGTLAVHGAQLDEEEIRALGMTGSALCLCPRSNIGIGVGLPRVASLLGSDVLLCLGTDGLSSAPDLDVRREAVLLRDRLDIPAQALLRLLTVNGASALGLSATGLGTLAPGSPARFCVLPRGLVP